MPRNEEDLTLRMKAVGFDRAAREVNRVDRSIGGVERRARRGSGQISVFTRGVHRLGRVASYAAASFGIYGLVGGIKDAINNARDLHEAINKTQVVFRRGGRAVIEWARTTAREIGISEKAALEASSTFGAMVLPAGIARRTAQKMSVTLTRLGSDLASFYNVDPGTALENLRSGLAGMSRPLRRYGIDIRTAALEEYAHERGITKRVMKMRLAEKTMLIYRKIMHDTNVAQGDFRRTSGALANSQRTLAAIWDDLSARLGRLLYPAVLTVTKAFTSFLTGIQENTGAGGKFARSMTEVWTVLVKVFRFLLKHRDAVIALAAAYAGARIAVTAYTVAQAIMNATMAANPIVIVVGLLGALAAALVYAYVKVRWFHKGVDFAFHAVRTAVSSTVGFIKAIWPTVWRYLSWTPFVRGARIAFDIVRGIVREGWKGILNAIIHNVNSVIDVMNSAIHAYNKVPLAPNIGDIGHIGDVGGGDTHVAPTRRRRRTPADLIFGVRGPLGNAGFAGPHEAHVSTTIELRGAPLARETHRQSLKRRATR